MHNKIAHILQNGLRFIRSEGSFLDEKALEVQDQQWIDSNFVTDTLVVEQNKVWLQFANISQRFGN